MPLGEYAYGIRHDSPQSVPTTFKLGAGARSYRKRGDQEYNYRRQFSVDLKVAGTRHVPSALSCVRHQINGMNAI